jgi:hypothetical protein
MSPDEKAILAQICDVYDEADPEPADLVDRVEFALTFAAPDARILRPVRLREPAIARSDEQTRLITFNGESLTIMVNLTPNADGTLRLDGWLTPGASHPIELYVPSGVTTTTSDKGGRFSFDRVHHGLTQITVLTDVPVITPAIDL